MFKANNKTLEHVIDAVLMFLLLTLNTFYTFLCLYCWLWVNVSWDVLVISFDILQILYMCITMRCIQLGLKYVSAYVCKQRKVTDDQIFPNIKWENSVKLGEINNLR